MDDDEEWTIRADALLDRLAPCAPGGAFAPRGEAAALLARSLRALAEEFRERELSDHVARTGCSAGARELAATGVEVIGGVGARVADASRDLAEARGLAARALAEGLRRCVKLRRRRAYWRREALGAERRAASMERRAHDAALGRAELLRGVAEERDRLATLHAQSLAERDALVAECEAMRAVERAARGWRGVERGAPPKGVLAGGVRPAMDAALAALDAARARGA